MECQICHEILENNYNFCITKCNHQFCCECIFTWTRKSQKCPMCRAELYRLVLDSEELNEIVIHPQEINQNIHFIHYQNNFLQFLKENVLNQYPMYISIIYKNLIEQCIGYLQNSFQQWEEQTRQLLKDNEEFVSRFDVNHLEFCKKEELDFECHSSFIFDKMFPLSDQETDIKTFNHILLECLYLYHLKNGWGRNNFMDSIQFVHDSIII